MTTYLFCNFVFTKLFRFCERKHPYPLYPRQSISDPNCIYTECYSESSQGLSTYAGRQELVTCRIIFTECFREVYRKLQIIQYAYGCETFCKHLSHRAIFRHKILHTFTSHINDAQIHTLHSWYSRGFTDYCKSFLSHKQTVLENICTNVEMAVCHGRKGYVYLGDN